MNTRGEGSRPLGTTKDIPGFPQSLLDRYRPLRELGRGAMGAVFEAEDRELGRQVAIKTMVVDPSREARGRFVREGRTLAALHHPNVLNVYAAEETEEGSYLVMELVDGRPLSRGLQDRDPIEVMLEVAAGLQEAHGQGILHRDVKPDNILLETGGRPVLVDFGLAFELDRTRMTADGSVIGTLAYVAPEVLQGHRATPAADWFSWGATLYRLLEGTHAFDFDQLIAIAGGKPFPEVPLRNVAPDSPAGRLILACMVPDPAARPHGPEALRAVAEGRALPPPPTRDPTGPRWQGDGSGAFGGGLASSAVRPPAPDRRPFLAGAALSAALVAGWFLSSPPGGAAPRPTPTATRTTGSGGDPGGSRAEASAGAADEAAGSPVDPDLPAALRAEISAATTWLVDDEGEVHREAPPQVPPGWREVLDRDPLARATTLAALPKMAALRARFRGDLRPEDIPPAVREDLRKVDGWYQNQGLAPPLDPYLGALGDGCEVDPAHPALHGFKEDERPSLVAAQGWWACAVSSMLDALEATEELDAWWDQVRAGTASPGFFAQAIPVGMGAALNLNDAVRQATRWRRTRIPLAEFLDPVATPLRRGLYATVRAVRAGQVHPAEAITRLFRNFASCFMALAVVIGEDPDALLLGPPRNPLEGALLGALLEEWARKLRDIEASSPALEEAVVSALKMGVQLAAGRRGMERWAGDKCLERWMACLMNRRDYTGVVRLWATRGRHHPWKDPRLKAEAVAFAARAWMVVEGEEGVPARLPGEAEDFLEWMRGEKGSQNLGWGREAAQKLAARGAGPGVERVR